MPKGISPKLLRYGVAVAAVAVATGLRWWLDPKLGEAAPFAAYYGALIVTAWYGGLGPTLLAVVLGVLSADYFFLSPRGSLAVLDFVPFPVEHQVSAFLFVLVGVVVAVLTESLHASRRRAEWGREQLQASEERYRTVADFTYDWEYWIGPEGTLRYVSPACRRITGYTAEEFLADSGLLLAIVHPEDRPRLRCHLEESLTQSEPCQLEFRIVTRQGEVRWIEHVCVPVYRADGQLLGRRVSNRDATGRIEAERAWRESQQRLALTQQIGHIGGFDADLLTGRVLWTEELEELFGLAPGSFEGTEEAWLRQVPPEDRAWLEPFLRQWHHEGPAEQQWEHRLLLADGQMRWMAVRARLQRDAQGRAVRILGAVLDITDQRRLEEELRQAKEAAETANQAKDRFLATISHELRTPMNAILGMTELALGESLSPQVRDYLQTGKESAGALLAILNELLDYFRLASGESVAETVPFRLRALVAEVGRMFGAVAVQKGLTLRWEIDDALPDTWLGDPLGLRQTLVNLVGNALKFTEQGGVTVRVHSGAAEPEVVEFVVADTGIGIAPADQERIFAPFAQAQCSTARKYGGTGLGLAISRNLVQRMGGQIWLQSEVGQGSCFHFTVPLTPAPALVAAARGEPSPAPAPVEPVALPPLRILLAEDNPASQKLTRYLLSKYGHTVEVANDGQHALERLEQDDFDLLLLDVQMPVLDGFQTTARIRALADKTKARTPIIAMTAHAMAEDLERCLAAGMDGYVTKPIESARLFETIQRLVVPAPKSAEPPPDDPVSLPKGSGRVAAELFSLEEAVQRCFGDYGLFQDLVDCFFCEVDPLREELGAAHAAGDATEMGRVAHRLKGTVGFLGAAAALERIGQLERSCRAGDLEAAGAALGLLRADLESLKQALLPHAKTALT